MTGPRGAGPAADHQEQRHGSDNGAVTQGRVMRVIRTASQQGVDVIQFLTGVARAPTPEDLPPLLS